MSRYQKKALLIGAFDRNPSLFHMNKSDRRFFINMLTLANDKELDELLAIIQK